MWRRKYKVHCRGVECLAVGMHVDMGLELREKIWGGERKI